MAEELRQSGKELPILSPFPRLLLPLFPSFFCTLPSTSKRKSKKVGVWKVKLQAQIFYWLLWSASFGVSFLICHIRIITLPFLTDRAPKWMWCCDKGRSLSSISIYSSISISIHIYYLNRRHTCAWLCFWSYPQWTMGGDDQNNENNNIDDDHLLHVLCQALYKHLIIAFYVYVENLIIWYDSFWILEKWRVRRLKMSKIE